MTEQTEQTEQATAAHPTIARITSAYLTAQREVDAKLGYSNPYAMPIALKAITDAADRLGPDATVGEVVDAAFHGRLRGTVRKVLRQRGQL